MIMNWTHKLIKVFGILIGYNHIIYLILIYKRVIGFLC